MAKSNVVALVALVILATAAGVSHAQSLPDLGSALGNWVLTPAPVRVPGNYTDLGIRKFINSFASFQFPYATGGVVLYDPLSRLEYPMDEWFIGLKSSQVTNYFSFNAEFWTKLNKWGGARMQDSDWEDSTVAAFVFPPNQKTTFSQSKRRLPQAYLADINVECAPFSFLGASLAGVVGWRWQTYLFRAYGPSFQYTLLGPPFVTPLPPGDSLEASYYFKDWFYLGGKGYFNFRLFELTLQGDYGRLRANMHDRHFLSGDFQTRIEGPGHAWHLSATLAKAITNVVNLRFEYDFKRLTTSHCTIEQFFTPGTPPGHFGPFPAGKIYSDQQSIAGYAEFRF
ncbi:MAG: omptin family outer membrane protease [Pseudomonadota bacterium]